MPCRISGLDVPLDRADRLLQPGRFTSMVNKKSCDELDRQAREGVSVFEGREAVCSRGRRSIYSGCHLVESLGGAVVCGHPPRTVWTGQPGPWTDNWTVWRSATWVASAPASRTRSASTASAPGPEVSRGRRYRRQPEVLQHPMIPRATLERALKCRGSPCWSVETDYTVRLPDSSKPASGRSWNAKEPDGRRTVVRAMSESTGARHYVLFRT